MGLVNYLMLYPVHCSNILLQDPRMAKSSIIGGLFLLTLKGNKIMISLSENDSVE